MSGGHGPCLRLLADKTKQAKPAFQLYHTPVLSPRGQLQLCPSLEVMVLEQESKRGSWPPGRGRAGEGSTFKPWSQTARVGVSAPSPRS